MIVPSIDLMDGRAVQLVGGRDKALDAGDPRPLAQRFGRVGEVAVIDLDAALGRGHNTALIEELCSIAPCRVGGGIRTPEAAIRWLDAGAVRVILGTAARPDVLRELPRHRVIVALDAVEGEVVVDGWRTPTGTRVVDRMLELSALAGGFLTTLVEREGRMGGIDLEWVKTLREAAGEARLTAAGGVTTEEEVAALDRLGVDAQVGMALYTGRLPLAEAFAAPLVADRADGLWPTVVVDEGGRALGLAYSSLASLREALATGRGVYHSRRRGLWTKGETSGDTQDLLRVDADCDRDTLRFTVRQHGRGFCHQGMDGCWGEARGLAGLERTIASRAGGEMQRAQRTRVDAEGAMPGAGSGSYTRRLMEEDGLLEAKLAEEAGELAAARAPEQVAEEATDLLYFASVALARAGVSLADVERLLDRRALQVTRRRGDRKDRRQ